MTDPHDPISEDEISIRDAFDAVYRTITPEWQIIEERVNPSSEYYDAFQEQDAKVHAHREASHSYDQFRLRAGERLRKQLSQETLIALFWDPEKKKNQHVSCDRWASMDDLATMSVFDTGIIIVRGVRRTVFFNRKNFESVLSGIAQPATKDAPRIIDRGGRPPAYKWDDIKAFALERIAVLGKPHRNNKRLPTKAQLVELIQTEWADRFDEHLPTSSVRRHINQWLAETDEN